MTLKVHSAKFPDPSTNRYVTAVDPTTKNCPGDLDLEAKFTTPELSIAVGSSYVTTTPPMLRPTVAVTSSQF